MRSIVVLLVLVMFFGCSKDTPPYEPTAQELVGRKFASNSGEVYVEVVSTDSLIWMVRGFRSEAVPYKLRYELVGSKVSFSVMDTVKEEYVSELTNETGFIYTYYSDSFSGVFVDVNTITSEMIHNREERVDDLYSTAYGTIRTTFDFHSVR